MKKEKNNDALPLFSRIGVMFGTDRFHNFMTAVCVIVGIVWIITYVVCVICRDSMMSQAVSDLAQRGAEEYRLVISSPMFTVLKFFMFLLPPTSILWMVSTVAADRKGKLICEKKLLFTALACIAAASFVAVIDLAKVHMIFG